MKCKKCERSKKLMFNITEIIKFIPCVFPTIILLYCVKFFGDKAGFWTEPTIFHSALSICLVFTFQVALIIYALNSIKSYEEGEKK